MPRRRELADVADGITGHVLWSIQVEGFPFTDDLGIVFRFDLMASSVEPELRELIRTAKSLHIDLERHLAARPLPHEWLRAAILTITTEAWQPRAPRVTCRLEILDDRGALHTSTRHGVGWIPRRRRLLPRVGRDRNGSRSRLFGQRPPS